MAQRDGLFITIEGIDGSGKTTQVDLLQQRLEAAGYDVVVFDFPQKGRGSAYFAERYASGDFGSSLQVGPYTACLFYALDHYDAAPQIRKALAAGKAVIAENFSASNMANQGGRITHPEERRGFFIWLDNLEFRMLNLPRPAMSFILRTPPQVTVERMRQPNQTDQLTDNDAQLVRLDQLQLVSNAYDDMCQLFPKDFTRIDSVREGIELTSAQIHSLIWGKMAPLVPEPELVPAVLLKPAATASKTAAKSASILAAAQASKLASAPDRQLATDKDPWYYLPTSLDPKTRTTYQERLAAMRTLYGTIASKLQRYAAEQTIPTYEAAYAAQLALPAATLVSVAGDTEEPQQTAGDIRAAYLDAAKELQKNYSDESAPIALAAYWPRNELELVPAILYEFSNQSLSDVQRAVSGWPYAKKAAILNSYTTKRVPQQRALESARYTWDVLAEFGVLTMLPARLVEWQPLSPRLGYDVPELIERAGVSEAFEQCFDISLELYSVLQAAGYAEEAQYATLLGHRARARITASARDMSELLHHFATAPSAQHFLTVLMQAVADVHPLLAAALMPQRANTAGPAAGAPLPKAKSKPKSAKPSLDK